MKKRIFSLMALVLFVSSITSMNSPLYNLPNDACTEGSFDAMEDMLDLGFSTTEAACVGDWFYYECTGNLVSVSDYQSCLN